MRKLFVIIAVATLLSAATPAQADRIASPWHGSGTSPYSGSPGPEESTPESAVFAGRLVPPGGSESQYDWSGVPAASLVAGYADNPLTPRVALGADPGHDLLSPDSPWTTTRAWRPERTRPRDAGALPLPEGHVLLLVLLGAGLVLRRVA